MHSVILYNKSKAGKYFLIKKKNHLSSFKTLNSKNKCCDITIPVRQQQVRLKVTDSKNPPPTTQQTSLKAASRGGGVSFNAFLASCPQSRSMAVDPNSQKSKKKIKIKTRV